MAGFGFSAGGGSAKPLAAELTNLIEKDRAQRFLNFRHFSAF